MEQTIDRLKVDIEKELKSFFDEKLSQIKDLNQNLYSITKFTEKFTLCGGKRLRSILMILTYNGYKKDTKLDDNILKLSIIWELYQSFLLVHDDIIDKDDVRRGGPTMHISLKKEFNDSHLGLSHAILNGDLLFLWAEQLIVKHCENPSPILNILLKEIENVIYGEMLDIVSWRNEKNLEKHIDNIHNLKTVSYTTLGPIKSGAVLANVSENEMNLLEEFAANLGLAFQIKDDYLGIFGDCDKTGKSNLSDLIEGKLTYLVSYALKKGDEETQNYLLKKLGNETINEDDFIKIKNIFETTGAKEYSENLIGKHSQKALDILDKMSIRKEEKETLLFLVEKLVNRSV